MRYHQWRAYIRLTTGTALDLGLFDVNSMLTRRLVIRRCPFFISVSGTTFLDRSARLARVSARQTKQVSVVIVDAAATAVLFFHSYRHLVRTKSCTISRERIGT